LRLRARPSCYFFCFHPIYEKSYYFKSGRCGRFCPYAGWVRQQSASGYHFFYQYRGCSNGGRKLHHGWPKHQP
jgi:hypothetical protein